MEGEKGRDREGKNKDECQTVAKEFYLEGKARLSTKGRRMVMRTEEKLPVTGKNNTGKRGREVIDQIVEKKIFS